jgi:hypothetical protein
VVFEIMSKFKSQIDQESDEKQDVRDKKAVQARFEFDKPEQQNT